ncbi:MAG: SPOR domain-containing protein [Eubacteriales bacterium]|nr:SPOR domain-containing protein [Eubacteriales bacterium]
MKGLKQSAALGMILLIVLTGCGQHDQADSTQETSSEKEITIFVDSKKEQNESRPEDAEESVNVSDSSLEVLADSNHTEEKAEAETAGEDTAGDANIDANGSQQEIEENLWTGVYRYEDGNQGLYFFVTEADDTYVKGYYIDEYAAGGYFYGIIDWKVENGNAGRASEPFNNEYGRIYYSRTDEGVLADYPDGWWPDRLYQQVDTIEAFKAQYPQMEWEDIMKQMTSGGADGSAAAAEPAAEQSEGNTALAPFYGVWVSASQSETDCVRMAEELQNKGFAAKVYDTVDWENLNAEHWFVVSAGEYSTEAAANQACSQVIAAGYAGAYVKYTGNHR